MALRDHSLDGRITSAAYREFSQNGFSGTSLRKIAELAGVTVGAIQVRYRSKDELFASLLTPFLSDIESTFAKVKRDYYSGGDLLSRLRLSMRRESDTILRLIFDHYDEAVLLLYKSAGSQLEGFYDRLIARKISESVDFFRSSGKAFDEKLLGFLISSQFDSYRRIIAECPDRAAAERYMDKLMTCHCAGWAALFEEENI